MADLMQKCDMPYALSVFLPESGLHGDTLSKSELVEVLGLNKDEYFADNVKREMTPLLMDLVEVIKQNHSVRPNKVSFSTQTDDSQGLSNLSLEDKLKRIDLNLQETSSMDRLMPYKVMEERMLKYKREVEQKAKEDLESEVRRLKEFEASRIRVEEA
jgi:DNA repair exonuclease SbcCD ATPase subunit